MKTVAMAVAMNRRSPQASGATAADAADAVAAGATGPEAGAEADDQPRHDQKRSGASESRAGARRRTRRRPTRDEQAGEKGHAPADLAADGME